MQGTSKLRVGSLFAGIGGFDLGFERVGMQTVWVCESDPYCQFVLASRFPSATRYSDVRRLSPGEVGDVDILAGGFPCQDISIAGNSYRGAGIDGPKSGLWSEFFRFIRALRPRYVVIENSSVIAAKGLDKVLCDLASCGYDAEWSRLSANAVGAPHIRERLFIVAYPSSDGLERTVASGRGIFSQARWARWRDEYLRSNWWVTVPEPPRVDDGFPDRLDEDWKDRTRVTGNALLPQIAEFIGEGIIAYEHRRLSNSAN